jgi:hypothetical protein
MDNEIGPETSQFRRLKDAVIVLTGMSDLFYLNQKLFKRDVMTVHGVQVVSAQLPFTSCLQRGQQRRVNLFVLRFVLRFAFSS